MDSGTIICQGTPQEVAESNPELAETWKWAMEHSDDSAKSGTDEDEETVEEERRQLATLCMVNPEIRHAKKSEKLENDGKLYFCSYSLFVFVVVLFC